MSNAPLPHLPFPSAATSLFSMSESVPVVQVISFVSYFRLCNISGIIWNLSFSFWLTSLSMVISRLLQMALFHSILWLNSIPLHTCTHICIHIHIYVYIYLYIYVCVYIYTCIYIAFPCSSVSKESACNAGDPGSGRSPGERNGNPL